jgi:excisionase family DNA binding protein
MAEANQPKKRGSGSKKEEPKINKPTLQEIAFINRTKLPPDPQQPAPNPELEKYCNQLFEMFMVKLMQFMDMYGGFHSKAKIMEMYDLTKGTLNSWIRDKKLPIYQVGRKIVIKQYDMEEFLKKYRKIMALLFFYLPDVLESGALIAA